MGQTGRGQRRVDSPMMHAAKDFGAKLFQATFHDATYFCLRKAQQEAGGRQAGLRIRLNLDGAPDLAVLPWEYLYNPEANQFLVLSNETPVLRQLTVHDDTPPFPIRLPIRILVAIASPPDQLPLDVENEWKQLNDALADLQSAGKVVLDRLTPVTLPALQHALRRQDYHVFHFIGHGGFDPSSEQASALASTAIPARSRWTRWGVGPMSPTAARTGLCRCRMSRSVSGARRTPLTPVCGYFAWAAVTGPAFPLRPDPLPRASASRSGTPPCRATQSPAR